jgi:hypothetical protein
MGFETEFSALLKQAEQLKTAVSAKIFQTEKDIAAVEDKEMQEFLKNSLSLARENKITSLEFIEQYKILCQQKSL